MKLIIGRTSIPKHSTLWGIGSLGNISGDYVSFRRYMQGNNIGDLRTDWQKIGRDIRNSMGWIDK